MMVAVKSQQKFVEKLGDVGEGNFTLTSPYRGSNMYVRLLHTDCNEVFKITPAAIFDKIRRIKKLNSDVNTACSICTEKKKKDEAIQKFKEKLDCVFGGSLDYHSNYKSYLDPITVKCNDCEGIIENFIAKEIIYRTAPLRCNQCGKEHTVKGDAKTC